MTEFSGQNAEQIEVISPVGLAIRLKQEGLGVITTTPTQIFGLDGQDPSAAFAALQPENNFSRMQALTLPKPLRFAIGQNPNINELYHNGIYVFHYPLNLDRALSAAQRVESYKGQSAKPFREWVKKFDKPSVIASSLTQGTGFLGEEDLMQEIMKSMKESISNSKELFGETISREYVEDAFTHFKSLNIYDLTGQPKEIHFTL